MITQIIRASTVTINQSGYYKLNSNVTNSAGQLTSVSITASNVELDLGGYVISHGSTGAKIIEVAASVSNVVIKNGWIAGSTSQDGIYINAGCSKITVENVRCYDFVSGGSTYIPLHVAGTSGSHVSDVIIKRCLITNCTGYTYIGFFEYCDELYMEECSFNDHTAGTGTIRILFLSNCTNVTLCNIQIKNNSASASWRGIELITCTNCRLIECNISNNNSGASFFFGIYLNDSHNLLLQKNIVMNNTTTNVLRGYWISNSDANIIQDCIAMRNSAGEVEGYGFYVSAATSLLMQRCISRLNTAAIVRGFFVSDSLKVHLLDSIAEANSAAGGNAMGIYFSGTTGTGVKNLIERCIVLRNTGLPGSYGIEKTDNTSKDTAVENFSYFNPTNIDVSSFQVGEYSSNQSTATKYQNFI